MGSNKKNYSLQGLLIKRCFNKYFIAALCFVIWLVFFDKHNYFTQQKIKQSVEQLKEEKALYEALLEDAKQERQDIEINKEKIAREKYLMRKDNEEVFIIEQKN